MYLHIFAVHATIHPSIYSIYFGWISIYFYLDISIRLSFVPSSHCLFIHLFVYLSIHPSYLKLQWFVNIFLNCSIFCSIHPLFVNSFVCPSIYPLYLKLQCFLNIFQKIWNQALSSNILKLVSSFAFILKISRFIFCFFEFPYLISLPYIQIQIQECNWDLKTILSGTQPCSTSYDSA